MLLGRVGKFLVLQLSQSANHAEASVARLDDIVDITKLGCLIGVGEEFCVLVFLLLDLSLCFLQP